MYADLKSKHKWKRKLEVIPLAASSHFTFYNNTSSNNAVCTLLFAKLILCISPLPSSQYPWATNKWKCHTDIPSVWGFFFACMPGKWKADPSVSYRRLFFQNKKNTKWNHQHFCGRVWNVTAEEFKETSSGVFDGRVCRSSLLKRWGRFQCVSFTQISA